MKQLSQFNSADALVFPTPSHASRWSAFGAALLTLVGCGGSALTENQQARLKASSQYEAGAFRNPMPMGEEKYAEMIAAYFKASSFRQPESSQEIPVEEVTAERFAQPPSSGLRITWLGHSSVLLEIDGHRILTDPVWSRRASPFRFVGPTRFHNPPLALEDLPDIDVVVLSHDHYDHLDEQTIRRLATLPARNGEGLRIKRFAVPLGVGQHLRDFGVAPKSIVERDWWEELIVGDLTLTCAPARHFSGRSIVFADKNHTLWAGWAMRGPKHSVYFTGDTGMFEGFREIGKRLGPFDAALVETGAYNALWSDVHLGPEQAVLAHQLLGAGLYIPVHWGTFDLAMHGWTEPVERVLNAAREKNVKIAVPRPGQSIEPIAPPKLVRWWPERPWQTAAEAPVVSTHLPDVLTAQLAQPPVPHPAAIIAPNVATAGAK